MRTISLRSESEIDLIRESSLLVGKTHGELSKWISPGMSTLKLDQIAETFIRDHGGEPAFKNYRGSLEDSPYPYSLCISMNEEVVHGMPGEGKILKEGDIVSIDCGVKKSGYYGDSAFTYAVGEISSKKRRLLDVTLQCLEKAIEQAVEGNRVGFISSAVQRHAESYGYGVVRELVGHGVGQNLHEPPEVPNYGRKNSGPVLKEGMILAIEPMINMGKRRIKTLSDGWTVIAADGNPSAHYEHTVAVRKGKAEILSTFEFIVNQTV